MTVRFIPESRRVRVVTSDGKFHTLTPEMLINLDSDLGDATKLAMSNPGETFPVRNHVQRRSVAA